jgi:hypothetical protein
MKTRTKKCGVFVALAAVLLLSAALIVSCVEAFGPGGLTVPQGKETSTFVPPPGKGYVMLNFGGSSGRTIRPASVDFVANVGSFTHFDVIFTPDTEGDPGTLNDTDGIDIVYGDFATTAFLLDNGDYIVEVWAFDTAHATNDADKAVAYGAASLTVVSSDGVPNPVVITLREITDDTHGGTGTLALKLTNAATPSPASSYLAPASGVTMTIIKWPGKESTGVTDFDLLVTAGTPVNVLNSHTEIMDPGFYQVVLTLSGADSKWGDKTISEILHIYQGMTSTYTATLPTVSRNVYDFSFNYNDSRTGTGGGATGIAIEEVNHGDTATEPLASGITNADDPALGFSGWYTVNNSWLTTNEYDFDTKVLRDRTIYARWVATGAYVTVLWTAPTGKEPAISPITSGGTAWGGLTSLTSPPTIVVTFPNTPEGDPLTAPYSGITWTCSTAGVTFAETSNTLTINLANAAYINLLENGTHTITAYATHKSGSYENKSISFTVNVPVWPLP